MKFLSQIQPVSLREQVVEQVRTAIIEGRLRPDDHVTEATLTEQLGVSRTPVREALILLEREGLLTFLPNRGAFVRALNEEDVEDIFSMRTALENFAAELVIERITDADMARLAALIDQQREAIDQNDFNRLRSVDMDFHRTLIHLSGNRLLVRSWEEIVAQIASLLYLRAEAMPEYDEHTAIRDHQLICQCYRSGDLNTLRDANRQINRRVASECQQALRLLRPVS